jgi:hypothetical protein
MLVSQCRVDVPRGRDQEALHAPRERALVGGFHQHVYVGPLDARMHDPDPLAHRGRDRRFAHGLVHRAAPQVADGGHDAHDDVQRVMWLERRPLLVPRSGTSALRLAPGALALAAMTEQLLLDMPLARPLRRRLHMILIATPQCGVNGSSVDFAELMANDFNGHDR